MKTETPEELDTRLRAAGIDPERARGVIARARAAPKCDHVFGEETRRPHALAEANGHVAMESWCHCGARHTRFIPGPVIP